MDTQVTTHLWWHTHVIILDNPFSVNTHETTLSLTVDSAAGLGSALGLILVGVVGGGTVIEGVASSGVVDVTSSAFSLAAVFST